MHTSRRNRGLGSGVRRRRVTLYALLQRRFAVYFTPLGKRFKMAYFLHRRCACYTFAACYVCNGNSAYSRLNGRARSLLTLVASLVYKRILLLFASTTAHAFEVVTLNNGTSKGASTGRWLLPIRTTNTVRYRGDFVDPRSDIITKRVLPANAHLRYKGVRECLMNVVAS